MNTFIGFGHVVENAKTRTVNVGGVPTLVTDFTVATNNGFGDKEKTLFVKVSLWRERGARLSQYLTKGRGVIVSGAMTVSAWVGNDGKARAQAEMANPAVELVGKNQAETAPAEAAVPVAENIMTDELPFD